MATFELTPRRFVYGNNGFQITKGEPITIQVHQTGVNQTNLFDSKYRARVVQQFGANGIQVPATDNNIYSLGLWDVKLLKR